MQYTRSATLSSRCVWGGGLGRWGWRGCRLSLRPLGLRSRCAGARARPQRPLTHLPRAPGFAEVDAPDPAPSPSLAAGWLPPRAAAAGACPFDASPLRLTPGEIGSEGRMVSLYAHESVVNCVGWALFRAGALKTTAKARACAARGARPPSFVAAAPAALLPSWLNPPHGANTPPLAWARRTASSRGCA